MLQHRSAYFLVCEDPFEATAKKMGKLPKVQPCFDDEGDEKEEDRDCMLAMGLCISLQYISLVISDQPIHLSLSSAGLCASRPR